jgi:hypothetical protein
LDTWADSIDAEEDLSVDALVFPMIDDCLAIMLFLWKGLLALVVVVIEIMSSRMSQTMYQRQRNMA